MKRFRMSVTASCYFTIEAANAEEAVAKARAIVRDLPFGEGECRIMACAARDGAINRQATVEKKSLAQGYLLRGLRIVRRDRCTSRFHGHANLLKRLWLRQGICFWS